MVIFSPNMNNIQVLHLEHAAMTFEHCSLEVNLLVKYTKAYQHDSVNMLQWCSHINEFIIPQKISAMSHSLCQMFEWLVT